MTRGNKPARIAARVEAHPDGWRNPFDRFEIGDRITAWGLEDYRIETKSFWDSGDTRYLLSPFSRGSEWRLCQWVSCRYCAALHKHPQYPVMARELEPLWCGGQGDE